MIVPVLGSPRIRDGVTSARGSLTVLRAILDVLLDNAHHHGAGAVGIDQGAIRGRRARP
jgi:hypothetical protein